jgi:hypothetical protein
LGASPLLSSGLEWLEGEEEALLAAEGEGEDDLFLTCHTINMRTFCNNIFIHKYYYSAGSLSLEIRLQNRTNEFHSGAWRIIKANMLFKGAQ